MTFVHFLNCLALAYAPYVVTYKSSILSEYNTLGKIAVAGLVYMLTQLAKMLALATFFPTIEPNGFGGTSLVAEVLKTTVDIADLVGIYYIIKQTMGKSELKVLVAGIGWSGAQVLFTNILSFWFGARGLEFDWKYIQMAFDANVTMVHIISMAALVWIWTRNDLNRAFVPMIAVLLFLSVYRTVIVEVIVQILSLNAWMFLLTKSLYTLAIAFMSLQLYVGFSAL